jgi:hypothetical protein
MPAGIMRQTPLGTCHAPNALVSTIVFPIDGQDVGWDNPR